MAITIFQPVHAVAYRCRAPLQLFWHRRDACSRHASTRRHSSSKDRFRLFGSFPHFLIKNALKRLDVLAPKKSAIIKPDRDPAVLAALDHLAYLILSQCHLVFPGESMSDQSDPIANFEASFRFGFLLHFPFAFSQARSRGEWHPIAVSRFALPIYTIAWTVGAGIRDETWIRAR